MSFTWFLLFNFSAIMYFWMCKFACLQKFFFSPHGGGKSLLL
uniref:Uncharacterized protein n=1 Tax=Rhizophora mucronata TaxID=61149 RepID=A0A2P2QHI7_RHIMU